MSAPIDCILPRLEKVRQRQPGQWSARCPAHEDKGPSLSIRETPEGAVLLHCFGGCCVADVVGALGLDMADLFPPRERTGKEPKRTPRLLTPTQALELVYNEAMLVGVTAGNIANGVNLSDDDRTRLFKTVGRIATAMEGVRHAQ